MLKSFIAVACVLVPSLTLAAEQTYRCAITARDGGNLVPREAIYTIDTSAQSASVFDPIVKFAYEAPVAASLSSKTDGTHQLKWRVEGLPGTRSRVYPYHRELNRTWSVTFWARYTVVLDPQTGRVNLRGVAPGIGRIRGEGNCKMG